MQLPSTDRFFNTAGPVRADWHYLIDPLERWDMGSILRLIAQGKYFVLHAPRQTGKTSCLLALMDYLNAEGRYQALYVNVEPAQAVRGNVGQAMTTICRAIAYRSRDYLKDLELLSIVDAVLSTEDSAGALTEVLSRWAAQAEHPIVLFIDEIDSLVGDTLVSVLRQLRSGYTQRPRSFPLSVVLCGVRDVRDYRIQTSGSEIITGGSAFNIKAESLRLGNFVKSEVEALLLQHTELTGQSFEPSALNYMWEQKILHKSLETTITEGLMQTASYADQSGAEAAHLICFNRNPQVSWDEKIFESIELYQNRTIYIWGM